VLKYFNEKQFFKIVQVTSRKSNVLGKLSNSQPVSPNQAFGLAELSDKSDTDSCNTSKENLSSGSGIDTTIY
jgi:hypothetical protein